MTIECVTLDTNHLFAGNPVAEQHRLRHRTIIQRQDWGVPQVRDMEYDQYDNPAATYLIWRDKAGVARGVSRLYPTDRPFMLKEHFSHMVTYCKLPTASHILEGSRFCIDNTLPSAERLIIARELITAYLEYALDKGITQYIGIMYPIYWHNLFIKVGWQPQWFGEAIETADGKKSRAGGVIVSHEALSIVRQASNITQSVLYYGQKQKESYVQVA